MHLLFTQYFKIYIYKFLIIIIVSLITLELSCWVYFKYISNDIHNLKIYKEQKIGLLQYKYFKNIDLVFPKPNIKIIRHTKEYTDSIITKDILGIGVGFFDDGIQDREIKAVAIGDSYTRGVGSQDMLRNNWVELIEKEKKNIDIVNLGNLGRGINDQVYSYNKIKNLINHNLVIYNFANDYMDNISDESSNYFISKKSKILNDENLQELINDLMMSNRYKAYLEYLDKINKIYYTKYFFLKIIDFLNIKGFIKTYKPKYEYTNDEFRLHNIDDEIYNLIKTNKTNLVCELKYCYAEDSLIKSNNYNEEILNINAQKINDFYNSVTKAGKKFILIVHPSSRMVIKDKKKYIELSDQLIQKLNKKITIIDIKLDLLKIQENDPELDIWYKYDGHYTIMGHKIIADIVSKKIK